MEHGRRNSHVNSLIWLKGCDLPWKIPEVQVCKETNVNWFGYQVEKKKG